MADLDAAATKAHNRRALMILAGVVVAALVGFGAYSLLGKKSSTSSPSQAVTGTTSATVAPRTTTTVSGAASTPNPAPSRATDRDPFQH